MANWSRILTRGDVEDRRSFAAPVIGGIGITGFAVLLLVNMLLGGSPEDVFNQLQNIPVNQQPTNSQEFEGKDNYETFNSQNKTYNKPTLVLFRSATESGCGMATSSVGPHYCPLDHKIYLDETFFDELTSRFGARGGDVAQAYVIAHEVGHHVQNELGVLQSVNSNDSSVKLELQADCYAGLWANSIRDKNIMEPNEIEEAMDAAASVGDDRIQETVTGYVNPESWTHGSSQQRVIWFSKGYDSGSLNACNTGL